MLKARFNMEKKKEMERKFQEEGTICGGGNEPDLVGNGKTIFIELELCWEIRLGSHLVEDIKDHIIN